MESHVLLSQTKIPIFLSTFYKELFTLSGTTLKTSANYHPQSGGQSEVVNRTLEQYLCSFVTDQPKQWYRILH